MAGKKVVTAKRCRLTLMKILNKLSASELKELISRLNEDRIDQVSEIGKDKFLNFDFYIQIHWMKFNLIKLTCLFQFY